MAKRDDIEERLVDFAVRIVKLCVGLPKTLAGQHIAGQLVCSGTASAAHCAETRGAERARGFVHKLRLCLKVLNESQVWLKIITRSEMLPASVARHQPGMRRAVQDHKRQHQHNTKESSLIVN